MSPRHLALAALGLVLALSACGTAGRVMAPVAGMITGGSAPPAALKAQAEAPAITVVLTARGITFPMRVLEREGDVTTWVAGDGAQMETRNGIVISTRGFGQDLMSSIPPSVSDLTRVGDTHERRLFLLNGADETQLRAYICKMERAEGGDGPAGALHVTETCLEKNRRIINEYWIGSGGRILKSRQFISPMAGYVIFSAP